MPSFLMLALISSYIGFLLFLGLQVLKQVMEEKLEAYNVELGVVATSDRQFRVLPHAEVQALLQELKPTEEEQSKQ